MIRFFSKVLFIILLAKTAIAAPTHEIFSYDDIGSKRAAIIKHLHDYGFVAINKVPGYAEAYKDYLSATQSFIALDHKTKAKYTPANSFIQGWSYGIERFNGVVDSYKGSYYAFLPEKPDLKNIWPTEVPEFKEGYLNLATIIFNTGKEIMSHLDLPYENVTSTGRMLYYGPIDRNEDGGNQNWCGLHRDHGMFTGLIPATFMKNGKVVKKPEGSGLQMRGHDISMPNDVIIFQVGETAELITNGKIVATDHLVRKARGGYSRYAFALFFEPPTDLVINSRIIKYNDRYRKGMTYGQWCDASLAKYNTDSD